MKCNQCGNENADTAAFCSKCGAQVQPAMTVSAPIGQNGSTITSTMTPNGPSVQISAPLKNSKAATFAIIAAFVVLLGIGALVWFFVGSKAGGEVITCTKEGKALTQSVATTFKKDQPTKLEYTYIFDKTEMPDDDDDSGFSFSFSTDEGLKSDPEEADLLAASFMIMAFSQYANKSGVEYRDSDHDTIRTVSFSVDLDKASNDLKDEILDEDDGELTPDSFQKEFTDQGFVCKKK